MKIKSKKSTNNYGERESAFRRSSFAVVENRPKNNPMKPHNRSLNAVNGSMSDS